MVKTENKTITLQGVPAFPGLPDILMETESALLLLIGALERENRAIVGRKLKALEDAAQDKTRAIHLLSQTGTFLKQSMEGELSESGFKQGKPSPFPGPVLPALSQRQSSIPRLKRVAELREKSLKLNEDNCKLLKDCITISDRLYALLSGLTASGFVYQASGAVERRAMTGRLMSGAV